jgi:membrane-associated phospholipid phosphatase
MESSLMYRAELSVFIAGIFILMLISIGAEAQMPSFSMHVEDSAVKESLIAAGIFSPGAGESIVLNRHVFLSPEPPLKKAIGTSVKFSCNDSIFSFRSQKGYFPSLIQNFGEQAASPFHFKAKEWLIAGAAAGIIAGLILVDNDIDDWASVQKDRHEWINKASPVISSFGSTAGLFSLTGFGLVSAAFKNEKGLQTSLLASQAYITSGVWVQIIKHITVRERPMATDNNSQKEGGHWYGPFVWIDQDFVSGKPGSTINSFPSGHTAAAFSIATVFAMQYKDKPAIPVISYSAATLVGISRLTERKHWASDVFVGAMIGYLSGRQVVMHYNAIRSANEPMVTFFQYGNQAGLLVTF